MNVLGVIAIVVACLLTLPAAILLVECLAALLPRPAPPAGATTVPRIAVLIPAHDEELGIAATVGPLLPQLGSRDRLVVIADNCTDGTAARARAAGAAVIERRDPDRRGKGYAIQFGLEHLDADPPDVVVLVDADCRISEQGLPTLAARAARTGRPVQGEYLLSAPKDASPIGAVNGLAILVRNRVRPRGLLRLGLPCQLTGSGMAFPWKVLREAPETGSHLVEDLVMGIEMAKGGHPPLLAPDVQVGSELPPGDNAAEKQRRRWEHGQLHTLVRQGPRLVLAGLLRLRPSLLGLGLDLMVPPLAMLVMLELVALVAFSAAAALGWIAWLPALIVAGALAAIGAAVILGWARFARDTIPARTLITIPFYVLWKIPLYASLLLGRKQRTWERTERR